MALVHRQGYNSRMDRKKVIERKIQHALAPLHLEVIDESHQHNVPDGSESHFKLVVVSAQFEGVSLIKRHREVNRILKQEFDTGLHALALHTMTPEEWYAKGGNIPTTPECLGGTKSALEP